MARLHPVLLLLAAACAGERAPSPEAGAPADAAAPPRVTILAPAPGDTTGPDVAVSLGASGVTIAPASGTREEGVAHHHLFLDHDAPVPGVPIPSEPGVIHLGTGDSTHVIAGVAPGVHRLIAVLAWGDHVPVAGAAADTVEFTVR